MGARPRRANRRPILLTIAVPRLHAVTDDRVLALDDFPTRGHRIASHAHVGLHLRSRTRNAVELVRLARALPGSAHLIVNDRVDVAVAAGAHGVHLPAGGLPIRVARDLLGPDALIGRSTHSADEARQACDDGADYVFLGPIWDTASHPGTAGIGLTAIAEAQPARVIAIGGVTAERAAACVAAGAWGVAAIRALWLADDVDAAVTTFLLSLGVRS